MGRKAPDAASADRDALYQSLYQEVRSEHDAIHNGYEEARRHLAEKNLTRSLEICEQFIAQYPNDPVFQALKLEAEELRRQELSEFIAEIGRRADVETDLDRKVNIFKEACERFPNEQQFQQSLKLTRERRDLVFSIVAKARHYEEKNLFTEAIGQWDTLRKIYPRYPGIEVELAHLMKRRDQAAKDESKARIIDQIDRLLDQGDYSRALERIANARMEEPQDPELTGLERLAQEGLNRSTEAHNICQQAQALLEQKRFREAADILHGAQELDPKDPEVRTVLVSALVEQARQTVDTENWHAAEPLLDEAYELDSTHAGARALRTLILDLRRKEFVSRSLAEARDLQSNGNVEGALAKVEAATVQYPNENRLVQQQGALQNLLREEQARKERTGDLETLKELRQQIRQGAVPQEAAAILERSQTILQKYPDDAEIGPLAAEINQWSTVAVPATPPSAPATSLPPPAAIEQAWDPPPIPAGQSKATDSRSAFLLKPGAGLYVGVVSTLLVIIGAATIVSSLRGRKAAPPPHQVTVTTIPVSIRTTPGDAAVSVNGEAQSGTVELSASITYDIVVSRPGYVTHRELGKRATKNWNFVLDPEPLRLTFATSAKSGKLVVDGAEKSQLQDGALQDLQLPADGIEHTVVLQGASGEVLSFSFTAKPGELPLIGNLKPQDLIAVSSLASNAIVYSGGSSIKANLDGQQPQPIPAEGLRLSLVNAADNAIVFDNKDVPRIPVDAGNAPSVYIGLNANTEIAYLKLQANVEVAHLKVDGVERKPAKPGLWRVALKPGSHNISMAADGYENHDQQIEIIQGKTTTVSAQLKPVVVITTAALVIEKGTPGSQVFVDGTASKTLDASGSASIEVPAGPHKIGFRKQGYEPSSEIARTFTAGQEIRLSENDVQLKKMEVRIPQPGTVDAVSKVAPTPVFKVWNIDYLFQNPAQVEQDGAWWKPAAAADYVFLKPGIIRRFNLTFSDPGKNLFGRKRKVEWVLAYLSNQEKVAYDFDGKKLTRKAMFNAKSEKLIRRSVKRRVDPQFTISIETARISVQPVGCDEEIYESTEHDLTKGQIGIKPNADFTIRRP